VKAVPSLPEITREALIVIAGAVLAAFVVGRLPALRDWIKDQWGDAPRI
jgi:hypothetical protein